MVFEVTDCLSLSVQLSRIQAITLPLRDDVPLGLFCFQFLFRRYSTSFGSVDVYTALADLQLRGVWFALLCLGVSGISNQVRVKNILN
ncbi:MAG: hypothetical protein ACK5IQ_09005 [Bacteroidales bacterium]